MLENVLWIGLSVAVFWLVTFAIYLFTARQQKQLEQEIATLKSQLEKQKES